MELLVIFGNVRNLKAPVLDFDFNGYMIVPDEGDHIFLLQMGKPDEHFFFR